MPKHGKKYRDALAKVDREKFYSPIAAMNLVKEIAPGKFDRPLRFPFVLV